MENYLQAAMLYDFYGELLTEKQKNVFEMYYQNDMSLSEIADEMSISRQGVRDQLKRTEKLLMEYEEKLKLVEKFNEQKKLVKSILEIINKIENETPLPSNMVKEFENIKNISENILK